MQAFQALLQPAEYEPATFLLGAGDASLVLHLNPASMTATNGIIILLDLSHSVRILHQALDEKDLFFHLSKDSSRRSSHQMRDNIDT